MGRSVVLRKSELEEIMLQASSTPVSSTSRTSGETVTDHFTINLDGKEIVLITTATKTPKKGSCETPVRTSFEIDAGNNDVFPVDVGDLTSSIIDRTHMQEARPKDGKAVKASWITECLNAVNDGEKSRLHSNDAEKAKQRTLRAVYNHNNGNPKSHADVLDVPQICYIPYFSINKEFRGGQGFPQWAMDGHRCAMKKLGFKGTYILSPAPLEDGAAETGMDLSTVSNHDWQAAVRKITASYQKSGFRVLHAGDASRKGSMTIMAMAQTSSSADQMHQSIPKVLSHTRTLTNRGFPKPMTATPGVVSAASQQDAPGAPLRGAAVGCKFGTPKPRAFNHRSLAQRRKHQAVVSQQTLLPTTSIEPPNDLELEMDTPEATMDYSHRVPSLAITTGISTPLAALASSSQQDTQPGPATTGPVQPLTTVPEAGYEETEDASDQPPTKKHRILRQFGAQR